MNFLYMKSLKLFSTSLISLTLVNILFAPAVTLAKSPVEEAKANQVDLNLIELNVDQETGGDKDTDLETDPEDSPRKEVKDQHSQPESNSQENITVEQEQDSEVVEDSEPESNLEKKGTLEQKQDSEAVEDSQTENESEDSETKVKQPTPEEIARLEKLALADQLYLNGDKVAAIKLYREAKEVWEIETEKVSKKPELKTFIDPAQLSPAGKVFWRNYQQGKKQQLSSKVISPLKLLTTREPQFLPGHIHYAETLLKYEREAESVAVLNRAVNLYPNEPLILRAKMNADIAAEQWLDASIMARQYALFNPDSPVAEEFNQLAETYLATYQSNLRSSITWNAIGNAIAGTVGFALTGNLFGPLSAIETTSLLLKGESAVGEASVKQITKQIPLMKDEAVNDYVNQIGQKIALVSGREEFDYQFYVVMDDNLNAFALPGGKIFVNVGAIMQTDSEAELAGLLAHEISHSALSHGFQLATKGNLTSNIVSYIPYVGNTASSLIVLNYSREMEKQADIFGTRILVNAGYAADGVRNLMAQLHKSHEDEANPEPPAWLSSHPNSEERISYMEQLIVENNLNRYAYEGVEQHQKIKQLVTEQWQEYEKCAEELDTKSGKLLKQCETETETETENVEQLD